MKIDENVDKIRNDWYSTVQWTFVDSSGIEQTAIGVYLICDGGYLRWPILICPYANATKGTREGNFSDNLESVRKDVECVFGILKKRWKIVEHGIRFRDIKIVEKIFVVCCMLHNIMLSEMEVRETQWRVGRGAPIGSDLIWLAGSQTMPSMPAIARDPSNYKEAMAWGKRRRDLAEHHDYNRSHKRTRIAP